MNDSGRSGPLSASEADSAKRAPSVEGVLPVIHERWSARSFAKREVSIQTLTKLFEAARWAPSAKNEQPWRFLVGFRNENTWEKIYQALEGHNRKWACLAPVLILGLAHLRFKNDCAPNSYALYDLGAAASYLALQAAALGLKAHQIAGFDHAAARQELGIPEEYEMGTVIAVGYQGEPGALGDAILIEREMTARTRKPIEELVFRNWRETEHQQQPREQS